MVIGAMTGVFWGQVFIGYRQGNRKALGTDMVTGVYGNISTLVMGKLTQLHGNWYINRVYSGHVAIVA